MAAAVGIDLQILTATEFYMTRLDAGVRRFREQCRSAYQAHFQKLSCEGQHPHTLFITCSDARVVAHLITQSLPGELFMVRNVGNIVPPANQTAHHSTAAAIEYAVDVLGVGDVVVCGHTQCGAMSALADGPPQADRLPHLRAWLEQAEAVRRLLPPHPADPIRAVTEANILWGIENLRSYPCVAERVAEGRLRLHGWLFVIATMEILTWNRDVDRFEPVETESRS
ncbi:MAG: carbonic anhydrase [Verrucomicrobiae bacterium]|nr:carbonic anhydrase [Verrucomicrobiae bacterium]